MNDDLRAFRENDRAAVHHFIRTVGRAPTDEELLRLGTRQRRTAPRTLRAFKPRAARLLVRL